MKERGAYSDTFIVRIWREAASPRPEAAWRGQVEHVRSSKRRGFQNMADLVHFLELWTARDSSPHKTEAKGGDVNTAE